MDSGLAILSRYLGFPSICLPFSFLIGGLLIAYHLPRLDIYVPGGAPVVQIFLEMIWFLIMATGFYWWRKYYRQKYGEKAYRQIYFKHFLWGGSLMFAGILRPIWVAGPMIPWLPRWVAIILGCYCLLVGVLLEGYGVKSLGLDRVALLYTVFPERGKMVESRLYHHLRHPLYSAMAHACLGFAFFSGTVNGFLCFAVFFAKIVLWTRFEEKELIARFGQDYKDYMKKVPAFFPRLTNQATNFKADR